MIQSAPLTSPYKVLLPPVKQRYFSPSNIQREAQAMLAGLPRFRQDRASSPEPAQAALLVLDLQKYFFEPGSHAFIPSAPAILPGVQHLIAAFARLERPIVFSQHINTTVDADDGVCMTRSPG
jgi:isochorismate hydrolase